MNKNKEKNNILTGFKRFRLVGMIALAAVVAVGIGAVVSAQIGTVNDKTARIKEGSMEDKNSKSVARQAAQLDDKTGQVRPLTPQEAQKLAEGIKELVNQSDKGLVEVQHADGSVSIDLQGRFQNVVLAKKNADGTTSESCVDNTESAASFLGINPKRFGDESKVGSTIKPIKQTERDANGDEIK